MPDTVVVTLIWKGQEADFELPAKVPLRGFTEPLWRAMGICFAGIPRHGGALRLKSEDGYLDENATLEDYGIFDGAVLQAVTA